MGKKGWRRDCVMVGRQSPGAPLPAIPAGDHSLMGLWMIRASEAAPPQPPRKKTRSPGGPLPVRGSREQAIARDTAARWSRRLGGLDLETVRDALRVARRDTQAYTCLLEGDAESVAAWKAKAPAEDVAIALVTLAAGEAEVRRARAAALQASFELGLLKKLISAGWLPPGPAEMHLAAKAEHDSAMERWAYTAKRRSEKGPLMVKGSPRVFVRNQ